jgi:hypothetical protein
MVAFYWRYQLFSKFFDTHQFESQFEVEINKALVLPVLLVPWYLLLLHCRCHEDHDCLI